MHSLLLLLQQRAQTCKEKKATMGKLTLYGITASPPTRGTMLTLAALGLDYDFSIVNLLEGEHLKPEFLKLNPQHTIPVLEDGDLVLYESRAINIYLASAYDSKNILIPACKKQAAKVHQLLYFDACTLASRFMALFTANVFAGKKEAPSAQEKKGLAEAMGYLEGFLKPTGFAAGTDQYTLADLSLMATYASIEATKGVYVNLDDYPESKKWFEKMKMLVPNYEKNCGEGAAVFGGLFKEKSGLI